MTRTTVALLVPILLLTGCSAPTTVQTFVLDDTRVTRSDSVLDDALDPDEPGCAAAVALEGRIVWTHEVGMADLKHDEPITDGTVFDYASNSKQFTGVAVLLLAERGDLALDDTLDSWFDELPDWAATVTVSDLLHHTSGIPDYLDLLDADFEDETSQQDAVDAIADVDELDSRSFEYSNSNYVLLADLVERASGETLPEFLDREVFRRLGLDLEMDPEFDSDELARSYERDDDKFDYQKSGWTQIGDGGIHGTATELALWGDNYRTGAVGGQALLEAQFADAVSSDWGSDYGAGIDRAPDGSIGHTGSWLGFVSALTVSEDRLTSVAVTCNLDEVDVETLADDLREIWRAGA
jgi:CubicO group peptidase (beta-lactamase class C family)